MTTTSWHKLFGLGACALLAAACTVSSGSDDDDDITTGIGGSGGSGGSTSSTSSGGSGGSGGTTTSTSTTSTTGSGGGEGGAPVELECLEDTDPMPEDPTTCSYDENDTCCTKCVRTQFCELNNNCFASPANICGGTAEGMGEDSEILTFIDCMYNTEGGAAPGTGEDSDFERCIGEATDVAETYCGLGTISGPTNELAVAIVGNDDDAGCFFECLDNTFDPETDVCLYDD